LNDFIDYVFDVTLNELVSELLQNIELTLQRIDLQLNSMREVATASRLDRIVRLEEALSIARAIGLEDSMIENAANNLNMEYMRGVRALAAEIDVLRQRQSDEPFIESYADEMQPSLDHRRLQVERNILNQVNIESNLITVARVAQSASVPNSPSRPNRNLIVAISFILGGMIGVFLALILGAVHKRRQVG